ISLRDTIRNSNRKTRFFPGWLKAPFGARSSAVIALVAVLALVAGSLVVLQITNQMRREADDRLAASSAGVSADVEQIMTNAAAGRALEQPARAAHARDGRRLLLPVAALRVARLGSLGHRRRDPDRAPVRRDRRHPPLRDPDRAVRLASRGAHVRRVELRHPA